MTTQEKINKKANEIIEMLENSGLDYDAMLEVIQLAIIKVKKFDKLTSDNVTKQVFP